MQTLLLLAALCVGAYAQTQFTASGQAAILNVHNTLRSKIAKGTYIAKGTLKPPASNMLKIKWDNSLALSAQMYASKCPNRATHSGTPGLGENLYWYWNSQPITNGDQQGAIGSAAWEKEFQDFGWKSNVMSWDLYNTGVGHATGMAWAKTQFVGCGYAHCGKDATFNGWNKLYVVCQYKQQGNIINQNIYNTGATCSACPAGTKCETATGLCV